MMKDGERQVAPTVQGIRRDHRARYEFAAKALPESSYVVDFACGVGYGASILAGAGHLADGYDRDTDALAYAHKHYNHKNIVYRAADGDSPGDMGNYDAAVCFETIEHIKDPRPLLNALRISAPLLIASVPNEEKFPYAGHLFHFRHYTKGEFNALLQECGWRVTGWYGQEGPESEVGPDVNGRTLIAMAERGIPAPALLDVEAVESDLAGKHIAIVGLGPSAAQYLSIVRGQGGRSRYCDEVWTINALGNVFDCDRVFHMDDVRIQEIRAAAEPDSNIAAMLRWMKAHPGPIVTSRAHPDYPGLVEFPLEDVVNDCPFGYFNGTAAYAVAYAVHHRVGKLSLFGCDFTYPNAHDAEKGRACVEYWLGMAVERGIKVVVPKTSSLLDACHTQAERFYGYDTLDIAIARENEHARIKVSFTERSELPTAEEMEARYDHSVHPSPLMQNGGSHE